MIKKIIELVNNKVSRTKELVELAEEMELARSFAELQFCHEIFDTIEGIGILVDNYAVLGYTGMRPNEPCCISGKSGNGTDYIYINEAVKSLPENIYKGLVGHQVANIRYKVNNTNSMFRTVKALSDSTAYKCDRLATDMGYDMLSTLKYLQSKFPGYQSKIVNKRIKKLQG